MERTLEQEPGGGEQARLRSFRTRVARGDPDRPLPVAVLLFLAWLTIVILVLSQALVAPWSTVSPSGAFVRVSGWLGLGLAAIPAMSLLRHDRSGCRIAPGRKAAVHLAGASLFTLGYAASFAVSTHALIPGRAAMPIHELFGRAWFAGAPPALLAYLAVVAALTAVRASAEHRRTELGAARLAASLSEARLGALRARLRPHFLFNALNSITVLVRSGEIEAATVALERLGGLLRTALVHDRRQEVALAQELALVERLVSLERLRFEDRLSVVFEIGEEARLLRVPPFVLVPLVENAIKHGLRARAGGEVRIVARRRRGRLELLVEDDGPGLGEARATGEGLRQTRERLDALYGAAGRLRLEEPPGGGVRAAVSIPLGVRR